MATAQNGTSVISTDVLNATTGLNGGAPDTSGEQVQRAKVGFGSDSFFRDVDAANGLPVTGSLNTLQATASADATLQNAVAVTGNGSSLTVTGYGIALLRVTGTFVAIVNFEASSDAGVNWSAISATQIGLGEISSSANFAGMFRITCAGMDLIRARVTWTSGTSITVVARASNAMNASKVVALATGTKTIGSIANTAFTANAGTNLNTSALALDATLTGGTQKAIARTAAKGTSVAGDLTSNPVDANTQALHVNLAGTNLVNATLTPETTKVIGTVNVSSSIAAATYSATISNLAVAALATDIFTIAGSATKTIRITKIAINGIQATAGQASIVLLKRSTADTAGTSTAPTKVPYDSTNAAATATVAAYTANPTTGTLVGNIFNQRIFLPAAASTSDAQGFAMEIGNFGQQQMALRGAAEQFAVNLAGVTITGGSVNISIEWTES